MATPLNDARAAAEAMQLHSIDCAVGLKAGCEECRTLKDEFARAARHARVCTGLSYEALGRFVLGVQSHEFHEATCLSNIRFRP